MFRTTSAIPYRKRRKPCPLERRKRMNQAYGLARRGEAGTYDTRRACGDWFYYYELQAECDPTCNGCAHGRYR